MEKNKDINFEINLLPVISLLAVLICFLLLTTAWVQVGTFDISQAIGGQSQEETKKRPSLEIHIYSSGKINIASLNEQGTLIRKVKSVKSNFEGVLLKLLKTAKNKPEMAIITPHESTHYSLLMTVMDTVRKNNIKEIGISPL